MDGSTVPVAGGGRITQVEMMAALLPELKCGLCGGSIDMLGDFFRASGAFLPTGDPLTPYTNAPLHWTCYAQWPERPRFARMHIDAWSKINRKNPYWWQIHQDDSVYVCVNPSRPVEEASVRLYEVGSDIRVPLAKWATWLREPLQVTPQLHALELEALARVLPSLQARFPDDHSVVDAIDPEEKQAARR
jgi:hypothetical protein